MKQKVSNPNIQIHPEVFPVDIVDIVQPEKSNVARKVCVVAHIETRVPGGMEWRDGGRRRQ